jgi:hypothetical protein
MEDRGRAGALLRREVRADLRLRGKQQAAVRLGGVKVMLALGRWPADRRTPAIGSAPSSTASPSSWQRSCAGRLPQWLGREAER